MNVYKVFDDYTTSIVVANNEDEVYNLISSSLKQSRSDYAEECNPKCVKLIGERFITELGRTCKELSAHYKSPVWLTCEDTHTETANN